jgi:hypothetical protein
LGLFGANFSHNNERLIMDFNYSHDDQNNRFKFYINHNLIHDFEDTEAMTEKEAYNLAEELFIEYLQNK